MKIKKKEMLWMNDLDKTSRSWAKPLSRENKEVLSFFVREGTNPRTYNSSELLFSTSKVYHFTPTTYIVHIYFFWIKHSIFTRICYTTYIFIQLRNNCLIQYLHLNGEEWDCYKCKWRKVYLDAIWVAKHFQWK